MFTFCLGMDLDHVSVCNPTSLTQYLPLSHAVDEVDGGVEFSASLEFRTNSCTGLLLYTASSLHPDHLALELVDGVVGITPWDEGSGVSQ